MKKIKLLLFTLCILNLSLYAQRPEGEGGHQRQAMTKEQKEEIESMKIAFLTKRLELTPDEAKKFWPVYNQASDEIEKLREARMKQHREMKEKKDQLTDKDYEKIVDNEISYRQQELDIMKKYSNQYKQLLPMKKVAALYKAEEEFKRELLQRMREKKRENAPSGKERD